MLTNTVTVINGDWVLGASITGALVAALVAIVWSVVEWPPKAVR